MAGKKRKQAPKRTKKKCVRKSKKSKNVDPKQSKLSFISIRDSGSIENVTVEVTRAESTSSNQSCTSELQQRFSSTRLSSGSSGLKRPCSKQGGPAAKRPAEMSHESFSEIDEEEYDSSESWEQEDGSSEEEQHTSIFSDEQSDLENQKFSEYQIALDDALQHEAMTKPPGLDEKLCRGVGDPSHIWNLMCKKDELERIQFSRVALGVDRQTRAILVDWMMEVCEQEKQHRETFHLSVNYLDHYLSAHGFVPHTELQCLGTVCLLLASKYEEIYPPKMDCFIEYTDGACNRKQVEEMEKLALNHMNWGLSVMTSVHWLGTFFQLMGSKKVEEDKDSHYSEKPVLLPKYLREQFMNMAKVLDICVLDYEHLTFSYRELAAAVLFLGYEPHSLVERTTGYTYDQMQPVIDWITPCYNYSISNQSSGDPLPRLPDVPPEEWHDIQTHALTLEDGFNKVIEERKIIEKKRTPSTRPSRKLLRPANGTRWP